MIAEASNSFTGQFMFTMYGLLGGLSAAAVIYATWFKPEKTRRDVHVHPTPVPVDLNNNGEPVMVEKRQKRFNADFENARHTEIDRRLSHHDGQISELWTTLRAEDQKTRDEFADALNTIRDDIAGYARDTERAIGRIEGKIDAKG